MGIFGTEKIEKEQKRGEGCQNVPIFSIALSSFPILSLSPLPSKHKAKRLRSL